MPLPAPVRDDGQVRYLIYWVPGPLDPPAGGNVLVCCSQPVGDIVIDL